MAVSVMTMMTAECHDGYFVIAERSFKLIDRQPKVSLILMV